ncbi:hypothetical protein Cni_G11874 [Canna indica]|uniref:K-box domain-containing protein n=1 Tax=Canna indica TaxID=4628 RepID=A0AAQ3K8G2_9LILI|nr:hypothetical protein Cni_G11874 [Canna indica]
MEKILERYQRYCYAEKALVETEIQVQGSWCHEYGELKAKIEALQKSQRHLAGEQLDKLTLKELQQLEQQLETALRKIRSKKNNVLSDSITELQRKEKALQAQNSDLEKKLKEQKRKADALSQQPQEAEHQTQAHNNSLPPQLLSTDSNIRLTSLFWFLFSFICNATNKIL